MIQALWRRLRRKGATGGDGLPADRRQGEGAQERVLRAFRVPDRSGHSEFVDSLDLTPAEAEEWPEGTDPPPWAHERIEERWWSWVNSMTTRPPASEQVARIRRIGRRWWRSSAVASRRSQPPGTRHTRAKRKATELPNQVHHEVPLDRRRFPVKLPADHFAAACSCGMVVMGATDEAREKWAAHLGRDVPKVGRVQRAARRVLARLRSWRDSARRPVGATARAVQIARETSPTDLIDAARLLADARHPLPHGPPSPYVFRDPSLIPVAAAASAVDATMVTITANTGAQTWGTNGAWVGGAQPTAANDVVIPASSTVTIASATTALCRSCTVQTSGTLAFAATTSNLNIGDGTAGAGNVAFSCSGTLTLTAIGTINFVSTSATQQTILSASTMPNVTFNGAGGSWLQSNALAATGATITLAAGTWATAGLSVSALVLTMSGSTSRTWTPGASVVTLTQTGNTARAFDARTVTNLVVTSNTTVVVITSTGAAIAPVWDSGTVNYNGMSVVVSLTTTGNIQIGGGVGGANPTIANFVAAISTGTSVGMNFLLGGNLTVTGTIALQGANATTHRLFFQSSALGTVRTITTTGASATASVTLAGTLYQTANVDIMDVTFSEAKDLSGVSGGSGDCQGNSGITFTIPAAQTYSDSGAHSDNWSTLARWTSRVPLPQDNVSIPLGSTGTITADMPRLGRNLDFTGYTGTLGTSTTLSVFGNLLLVAGMTTSISNVFNFSGRGAQTLNSAGKAFGTCHVQAPGGSYSLLAALSVGSGSSWNVDQGGFSDGGFTGTVGTLNGSSTTTTRSMTLTGTWNLIATAATAVMNITSSGMTMTASSATFILAAAATSSRTFAGGGGFTYGTLQYTVSGSPGPLVVTGANTFANITVTTAGNAPKTLTLPSSTTTTVTGVFTLTGTAVSGSIYLPGLAGSYISTPNAAWNQITGDIDLRWYGVLDNWSTSINQSFISKYGGSAPVNGYSLNMNTGGNKLAFNYSNGASNLTNLTTVTLASLGLTVGAPYWLRGTYVSATGVSNFYYTSVANPIATDWIQIGATVTGTPGALVNTTSDVEIGAIAGGTAGNLAGKTYKVQILNGIGGTVVASPDFTTTATGLETSYTDAQANLWTVNGAVNSNVYLNSSTVAVAATVATAGATWGPNVVVKDITATPSKAVYDLDGTNVSGNTGIVFSPPDVTPQDRQPVRVAVGASIRSTRW